MGQVFGPAWVGEEGAAEPRPEEVEEEILGVPSAPKAGQEALVALENIQEFGQLLALVGLLEGGDLDGVLGSGSRDVKLAAEAVSHATPGKQTRPRRLNWIWFWGGVSESRPQAVMA